MNHNRLYRECRKTLERLNQADRDQLVSVAMRSDELHPLVLECLLDAASDLLEDELSYDEPIPCDW